MAEYGDITQKSTSRWPQTLSRRQFLISSAALGAAAVLSGAKGALAQSTPLASLSQATRPAASESVVVIGHNERVLAGLQVRTKFLREILDESVIHLSGQDTLRSAWAQYVVPGQRILLKFSEPVGILGSEEPMLSVLLQSLEEAGHHRKDITVADGPASAFSEGAIVAPSGWCTQSVPLLGEQEPLRRYLDGIDAIISVPFISHHNRYGVSCAMTNVTLPFIRHPSKYDSRVDEAIVSLYEMPQLQSITRVTIVNAVYGSFDHGPAIDPSCLGSDHSLWASRDAVALDRLALEWVQRQRRIHNLSPLSSGEGAWPGYIKLAADRGLGQDDLRLIRRDTLTL